MASYGEPWGIKKIGDCYETLDYMPIVYYGITFVYGVVYGA